MSRHGIQAYSAAIMTVWYSVCILLGFAYLLLPSSKRPRH